MSELAQMAAIDAAIAENELDEDEAAELREHVAEGGDLGNFIAEVIAAREPAPAPTPAAIAEPEEPTEKQWRELGKENERHVGKVREIMGGFVAGFGECEACQGAGIVPPGEPEPEVRTHELFKACETCNGYGQVRTGALNPQHAHRECPACKGRGYLEAIGADGRPLADGGTVALAPQPQPAPIEGVIPPAPNGQPAGVTYGTPSWLGDPSIGQQ